MASPSGGRQRGREGEELAARFLCGLGYRVLARNVHLRVAELDLIALERDTVCFVEVRLRSGTGFGTAEESIDARKIARLRRAARAALASLALPPYRQLRFDVVAIDASRRPPAIRLIRDAF
jgi:putative endonuclease